MIKRLKREHFELLILGTRNLPHVGYIELSFWSNLDETIIGSVVQDQIDNLYAYVILIRDVIGRFRFSDGKMDFPREHIARKALKKKLKELTRLSDGKDVITIQGDEPKVAINLIKVPENISVDQLHPAFKELTQNPAYIPAKKVIEELSPWIQPKDRHLEKEFQINGFDQRIWEIYLWAALKELRFDVTQLEAPDFLCKWGRKPLFTIEATTVAPSTSGPLADIPDEPHDLESIVKYNDDYMSIKFGSSLKSKLEKKPPYWQQTEAKGLPFILAIADFHRPDYQTQHPSMTYTHSALAPYLYGFKSFVVRDEDGNNHIESQPIEQHKYLDKEIPSGFFNLPNAENISAILFCNAGTIAKFNRMGILAGFGLPNYRYIRTGEKYNISDPIAAKGIPYSVDIQDPDYRESWSEELNLFHNPNALYPLNPDLIKDINQHFCVEDHIQSIIHQTWIYSATYNFGIVADDKETQSHEQIDEK